MPNHYTTIAVCSPGHEFKVDEFNERHKESDLCSIVRPMPEHIKQVPATSYPDGTTEKERRGLKTDWYDWALNNWGTKWGTYDAEAFDLGGDGSPIAIKFQSAWSAPNEEMLALIGKWLCETFKFEKVAFIGFDPYDDSTSLLSEFHGPKRIEE